METFAGNTKAGSTAAFRFHLRATSRVLRVLVCCQSSSSSVRLSFPLVDVLTFIIPGYLRLKCEVAELSAEGLAREGRVWTFRVPHERFWS